MVRFDRPTIVLVLLFFFCPVFLTPKPADATSDEQILTYNVLITGTLNVLRSTLEGDVDSWEDGVRVFAWGGVGGAGFYEAKQEIAEGDYSEGMVLSNLSYSIVENSAEGHHPLSSLGYSVGPLRFHYNTLYHPSPRGHVSVDYSLTQTLAFGLALSINEGDDISFEHGQFVLRSEEDIGGDDEENVVLGANVGYFNILSPGSHSKDSNVYRHEFIHGVQSMQIASTSWEPFHESGYGDKGWFDDTGFFGISPAMPSSDTSVNWVAFDGWRVESTNILVDLAEPSDYDRNLEEIEAWKLTEGEDPPDVD